MYRGGQDLAVLGTCTVAYVGLVMRRRSLGWVSIWAWLVQLKNYKQIVEGAPVHRIV